jgi:predicted RNase H-like HicB family nuclease
MDRHDYPLIVEPLPGEEGGGYLALLPDLPGCMSNGATPEEAVRNVSDAILAWIEEARATGRPIPAPSRRLAIA